MNRVATETALERDLSRFVRSACAAWNAVGVQFLVMRNYEALPRHIANDIDVLVSPSQRRLAEATLIEAARSVGYEFHHRAEFTPTCLFFHDTATLQQVQVDLFGSLGLRTLEFLSVSEVLERRIHKDCFAVPHPLDEATLNLLTRLLYQNHIKQDYRPGILAAFNAAPDEARRLLEPAFGSRHAAFLVASVQSQSWKKIEHSGGTLRRALLWRQMLRHPIRTVSVMVRDVWRIVRRFVRPPGLSVVLLGADGSGKSTVAEAVIKNLQHTFACDKGLEIHWKPTVFFRKRRANRPPTTDPHAKPPRGPIASLVLLGYHWLEFFCGAMLQSLPVRFRNGLVMIDRHYYDFLVDPRRYRLIAPQWAVRLGAALLPKPDLVFLLDAPPEVLQSRKQEVPHAETKRQCKAFLELVRSLSNGRVVDVTQSPEDVACEITAIIFGQLEARCRERRPRQP